MTDAVWEPELTKVGRRIDRVDGDLERAICEKLYKSPQQKRQRLLLMLLLGLKHTLRGLLFSWPLYLIGIAAVVLPAGNTAWLGLFLAPAILVSFLILRLGVVEDYRRFVHRVLLKPGAIRYVLWPDQTVG